MFTDVIGLGRMGSAPSASVPVTFKLGKPLFSTEQILYDHCRAIAELGRRYFRSSKSSGSTDTRNPVLFWNVIKIQINLYNE